MMDKTKRRLPTLEDAQKAFSRIPKNLLLAFAAACVVFIIVHAGFFDDRMVNEDYRHYVTRNLVNVAAGRLFDFYLFTTYQNSWTRGCEGCLYLALISVMIVNMFRIRTKIGTVLSVMLIVGMPSLAYMFSFLFSVPLYGRIYFLAVLAVWVTDRWRWGFIPAIVILACALGVGQAALIAAAVLCALALLRDVLFDDRFSYKRVLQRAVRFLIMGICGVLFYLLLWHLLCSLKNVEISNYDGMDQIGRFTIRQLGSSFLRSYKDFYLFFFGNRFFYVSRIQKVVNILLFAMIGLSIIYTSVKYPVRIPGILIALFLVPPCIGCIDILVPQVNTDTLMVYPIVFAGVLAVHLAEDAMPANALGTGASWILLGAVLATCVSNLDITSAFYVKAEAFHEQTAAYENRLLSRIESTPGYYPGIPVAIVNDTSNEYKGQAASYFAHVINDRDLWYSYVGTYTNVRKKTISLIQAYTGVSLASASEAQVQQVHNTAEFREMSAYPLDGSLRVIDGILVVNTVYREIAVMQVDANTVLLDYIDHIPAEGDSSCAWYVYRNNERVPELERDYRSVAEHLVTLTEDGTYTFKGFKSRDGNKQSVKSFAVVVKNGAIVADAKLQQITPEEAAGRALPPAQVSVAVTGDRSVSLKMLDNSLHAGWEYSYAWRVYRDGVHMPEYDRAYGADPGYDLNLAEDGVYSFELLYRKGSEGKEVSVLSEELEITHELDILQVNRNTVLLDYVGPSAAEERITYAWYVYKGKERIADMGRDYQENPGYLVTLEEDGTYSFKCFCLVGSEKRSVMSFPIIIKDGSIAADPRLGQISMEEAIDRNKPPVEVEVTLFGERGVKLTMIDNSLNAGPEYTYAWYVYKDGERVSEYDRGYYSDPEYDLILAEDGEYRFKLFYRIGKEKSSVMSEIILIGEAQSNENAA